MSRRVQVELNFGAVFIYTCYPEAPTSIQISPELFLLFEVIEKNSRDPLWDQLVIRLSSAGHC